MPEEKKVKTIFQGVVTGTGSCIIIPLPVEPFKKVNVTITEIEEEDNG